ncbi:hypothetical protein ATI61_11850 [Archangium gephyra]|uniref:Uncharacterized protein n=1 Tax=Archangium gephyra TaxID=48 RepID=A0ABX9JN15_9BACT|nr:hypothetical protein ATI61_11850 [Archangium gephyra]
MGWTSGAGCWPWSSAPRDGVRGRKRCAACWASPPGRCSAGARPGMPRTSGPPHTANLPIVSLLRSGGSRWSCSASRGIAASLHASSFLVWRIRASTSLPSPPSTGSSGPSGSPVRLPVHGLRRSMWPGRPTRSGAGTSPTSRARCEAPSSTCTSSWISTAAASWAGVSTRRRAHGTPHGSSTRRARRMVWIPGDWCFAPTTEGPCGAPPCSTRSGVWESFHPSAVPA